jgi:hypothetical protein
MTDERFERFVRDAAQEYNAPPPAPRDEMWVVIDEARAPRRGVHRGGPLRPWMIRAAGIAAVLVIGVGIGMRLGSNGTVPVAVPVGSSGVSGVSADDDGVVYRVAAVDYLERTDTFLALFRSDAPLGLVDADVADWAGELLSTARLMLDSPAGNDPQLRQLFQDLELVLVQINQYASQQSDDELDLIEEGLEEQDLMLRLRAALSDVGSDVVQGAI